MLWQAQCGQLLALTGLLLEEQRQGHTSLEGLGGATGSGELAGLLRHAVVRLKAELQDARRQQKDALQTTELLKELPDGVYHELVLALLD